MMKGKIFLSLLLGAMASGLRAGLIEADEGHLHIGDLSSGASIAVVVAGAVIGLMFIIVFLLRWRQFAQSSRTESLEDGVDQSVEVNDREGR